MQQTILHRNKQQLLKTGGSLNSRLLWLNARTVELDNVLMPALIHYLDLVQELLLGRGVRLEQVLHCIGVHNFAVKVAFSMGPSHGTWAVYALQHMVTHVP